MSDLSPNSVDTPLSGQISRGSILIVDDEKINRAVMCRVLERDGFETLEAGNGRLALSVLESNSVDLVLLDIVMPEMDGFETLKWLRDEMPELDIPVIMVTANENTDAIIQAFQLGANDYISKPFDPAVMMARINLHLQFAKSRADLRKSEERYALVAQGTNDGLWDWDLGRDEIFYSQRWFSMLGMVELDAPSPDTWFSRIHPEDFRRVMGEIKSHFAGNSPHLETEMRMRHVDGSFRWTLCRGQAVFDSSGQAHRIAGSLTDITEGKVADALTGLPNRVLFRERLDRGFNRRRRDSRFQFGLLYLDLDNFKLINDSLGHEAGDRLLVAIARRLEGCLRDSESLIYRLGGDEFSVLVEGIHEIEDLARLAERIITSVGNSVELDDGRELYTSVSVGISYSGDEYRNASDLIQAADTAMYHAKQRGKSCYRVFDPAMKQVAQQRLNIESELRQAIDRQEFECHFQPIVDISTRQVTGFEGLIRWANETLGQVPPNEFIPVAEEIGLIESVGMIVLEKACQQMVAWRAMDARFENLTVSVNLSSRQLKSQALFGQILAVINKTKLAPQSLKLEVSEDTIMNNPQQGAKVLSLLQAEGIKVAIDDFGTGYSSLSCIHDLSPDAVKIDRRFVHQIDSSPDKENIARAIIGLANGLNLDVVAEGIETPAQHAMLGELGCQYAQGFLYSKPLPPRQLFDYVVNSFEQRAAASVQPPLPPSSSSVTTVPVAGSSSTP